MKIKYLILFVSILFIGGCKASVNKQKDGMSLELNEIMINNSKIDSLINVVINDNLDYIDSCLDCFLLIGIVKDENIDYINIIIYSKERFTINSIKNNYPIRGYSEINNQPILFVGDFLLDGMVFLNKKKKFVFNCEKEEESSSSIPPPPPSMYNPPYYIFKYE